MSRNLAAAERWDQLSSVHSNPLRHIKEEASLAVRVRRIEIPRRVWDVLQRHPEVMSAYESLRIVETVPETCKECGAVRTQFRPPLDSKIFNLLLNANADGPIFPDAVRITEDDANEMRLIGKGKAKIVDVLDRTNTARYGAWR